MRLLLQFVTPPKLLRYAAKGQSKCAFSANQPNRNPIPHASAPRYHHPSRTSATFPIAHLPNHYDGEAYQSAPRYFFRAIIPGPLHPITRSNPSQMSDKLPDQAVQAADKAVEQVKQAAETAKQKAHANGGVGGNAAAAVRQADRFILRLNK